MKKKLICLMAIFIVIFPAKTSQAISDDKRILYLATGKPNQIIPRTLLSGFEEGLKSNYEVYVEYLGNLGSKVGDYTEEEKKDFKCIATISEKRYGQFDIIVCAGDVAASLVIENYNVVEDSDIVLLSISDESLINEANKKGVRIISEQNNLLRQNIDLIVGMYGTKRKITVLAGPEEYNKGLIKEFNEIKEYYTKKGVRLEIKHLTYERKEEVRNFILTLNKKKDLLLLMNPVEDLLSVKVDAGSLAHTEIKNLTDILSEICKSEGIPVYSNIYESIRLGGNGGIAINLYKQGQYCANEVMNIDKLNETLTIMPQVAQNKSIDVRKAFWSGVSFGKIPEGIEKFINSKWGVYRYEIHVAVLFALILVLLVTIGYFMYKLRKEKERAEEISRLKEKAEEANKMKDKLMHNISHELRTPVTVISSSCQMIKKVYGKTLEEYCPSAQGNIDIIEQNAYRLTRLINNVIDVTKTEEEYVLAYKENIEVISFIENIVMTVVPYAEKKDLALLFDTEIEELIMAIDIDKMDRILLNLLSNAIKFTNEGGRIEVILLIDGGKLMIEIRDTGIGIDEEKLAIIFDKFSKVDSGFTRMNEGSGIGLSLVKSFVDQIGGNLSVKSKKGFGTTFIVELPIVVNEAQEAKYEVFRNNMNTVSELSDIYL